MMTIVEYAQDADIFSLSVPKLEYVFLEEKMSEKSKLLYSFSPVTDKITLLQKSGDVIVTYPMEFSASNKQDSGDDHEKGGLFFELKVEYKIVFRSKKKTKVPEQVKKELFEQVVPRVVHPYFRQTVAEALQKAGLPPLQIPLIEGLEKDEPND
ncbi:MAG TPA: hypothetical protein DHV69_09185 [Sphaerochaeta sp.]|nr:MAG: hypothetical protein CVV48_10735 [Spirochaetae bacterium HGW-Spirochaetae-4]HCJ95335.1 hypothetical protein [Sphaerochaeta sp.]HCS35204.1 hypothetical protein [Sphaerochaeta sp.]